MPIWPAYLCRKNSLPSSAKIEEMAQEQVLRNGQDDGFSLNNSGSTAVEACRQIGIAEQTLYRWGKEYGGLKVDQARRMKDLERENVRLNKLVADLALDKAILQEASKLIF